MSPPILASPKIHTLLTRLHAASSAQESSYAITFYYLSKYLRSFISTLSWSSADDAFMRDKFIALEPDKCQFVYLLARSISATTIVEAGTSFGVSTIYLALAAGQNVKARGVGGKGGRVFATEKEESEAERARGHWKEAGVEVEPWIQLLEGDLLQTLPPALEGLGEERVDLLLLDIWAPLALPTLKVVRPSLRPGAIVIADNTKMVEWMYKDFLDYIRDPVNGFRTMTTPFAGGLEMAVYLPSG